MNFEAIRKHRRALWADHKEAMRVNDLQTDAIGRTRRHVIEFDARCVNTANRELLTYLGLTMKRVALLGPTK